MENRITVKRERGGVSYIVASDVEKALAHFLGDKKKVIIITDQNLLDNYAHIICQYPHIVIGQGEENKTLQTAEMIYTQLLDLEADRHTYLVGFGGGIVTDITGFVASTYLRGLGFGFVATSLLAQVDASVGGKNGVNLQSYKNMVGLFNQPDFVICDPATLKTLPERELRAGMAEAIKSAVIKNSTLFDLFEEYNFEQIKDNEAILRQIIEETVKIKAAVVEEDERENGERKKLNFGHTLAHAIEKNSREFNHGEAVAIGMVMASELSLKLGYLKEADHQRIVRVIENMGFKLECGIEKELLFTSLKSDKKRNLNTIDFIVATSIGSAEVVNMDFEKLEQSL